MSGMRTVYLDNAATTPLSLDAFNAMRRYFSKQFYNPSANYDGAYEVNNTVENCRKTIAKTIGCSSNEIIFVSGGSEADNWAIRFAKPGQHIITTQIEHHAILNTCKYLESIGVEVTYIAPDEYGRIDPLDVETSIQSNTILISVMMANNEIGTIQDIMNISDIASKHNVLLHTDAVQAYGHIDIDVNSMGIDMMSVSAHKFNGPKGVGFLYVSNRVPISPLIYGGSQEFGKRAGTYNVPGIVGMAKAAEIACENIDKHGKLIKDLRDYMESRIITEITGTTVNGIDRLPNNLNVCFSGIRGEQLIELLSMNGIYASTGSACNSSLNEPSHVLKAIGLSDDEANSSIRFTLSQCNTKEEIDYAICILKECIDNLRSVK